MKPLIRKSQRLFDGQSCLAAANRVTGAGLMAVMAKMRDGAAVKSQLLYQYQPLDINQSLLHL